MLSTLPIAKRLANKNHVARWIAAQIASAFSPTLNLTPMINEAFCYGCMAGLVMPIHEDIAPCDRSRDDWALKLNDDSTAPPQPHDSGRKR
jgi:hypothetical protein